MITSISIKCAFHHRCDMLTGVPNHHSFFQVFTSATLYLEPLLPIITHFTFLNILGNIFRNNLQHICNHKNKKHS